MLDFTILGIESITNDFEVLTPRINKAVSAGLNAVSSDMSAVLKQHIELDVYAMYDPNSIYITCKEEYSERRIAWDKAIGYCNALKDKFHEILSTIKVSVGAYQVVGELLQKEINLLKGVRKSDNQILTKLS